MEKVQKVLDKFNRKVNWADDDGDELPDLKEWILKTDMSKEERYADGVGGLIDTLPDEVDEDVDDGVPVPFDRRKQRPNQAFKDVNLRFERKDIQVDEDIAELIEHISSRSGKPSQKVRSALLKLAASGLSGTSAKASIKKQKQAIKISAEYNDALRKLGASDARMKEVSDELAKSTDMLANIQAELDNIRDGGDMESLKKVPSFRDARSRLEVSINQLKAKLADGMGNSMRYNNDLKVLQDQLDDANTKIDNLMTFEDAALLQMTAGTTIGNVEPGNDEYVSTQWPLVKRALDSYFIETNIPSPVIVVSETKMRKSDIMRPIRNREVSVLNVIAKHFSYDMKPSILPSAISGNTSEDMHMSFHLLRGNSEPNRDESLIQELEDLNIISYAGYDPELWTRGFGIPTSQVGKQIVRAWKSRGLMPLTAPDLISEFDPAYQYKDNQATNQRDQRSVFGLPLYYGYERASDKQEDDDEKSEDLAANPLEDMEDENFE